MSKDFSGLSIVKTEEVTMSIDLVFKKCPNCSANIELIPGSDKGKCEFCGSSFVISPDKIKKEMKFNKDWAHRISEMAVMRFQNKYEIDLSEDSGAMERIIKESRKVAMELEEEEETTMNVPFITVNARGPLHICEEYSRSDMD